MGQNIKDFNSWKKLNESGLGFTSWISGLFTGDNTVTDPNANKSDAENKEDQEETVVDKVKGAAAGLAGALGIGSATKGKEEDKKEKSPDFKKFGSKIPAENIAALEDAMDRHGITNQFARKAILGVVSKESPNLEPETDYSTTSNERIREVFGERVAELSDSQLTALKSNPTAFWDRVYGPDDPTGKGSQYGNTRKGDGERYRGRGFNGITFKSNYKNLQSVFGKLGKLRTEKSINIVDDPELLEDPDIAAEFAILYYVDSFKRMGKDLNAYKDLESAVTDYVRATAGWGSDITTGVKAQGFSRALDYAQSIS